MTCSLRMRIYEYIERFEMVLHYTVWHRAINVFRANNNNNNAVNNNNNIVVWGAVEGRGGRVRKRIF